MADRPSPVRGDRRGEGLDRATADHQKGLDKPNDSSVGGSPGTPRRPLRQEAIRGSLPEASDNRAPLLRRRRGIGFDPSPPSSAHPSLALLATVVVRCTTTGCGELTSRRGHRASTGRRETEAVAGSVFGRVAHSPRAGARRGTASGKLYGGKASVRRARRGTPRNGAGVSHRTHSTEEEGLWG